MWCEKIPWEDYVRMFMGKYDDFPCEAFGKWALIKAAERDTEAVESNKEKNVTQSMKKQLNQWKELNQI
jgi:hypothetical protein